MAICGAMSFPGSKIDNSTFYMLGQERSCALTLGFCRRDDDYIEFQKFLSLTVCAFRDSYVSGVVKAGVNAQAPKGRCSCAARLTAGQQKRLTGTDIFPLDQMQKSLMRLQCA